MVLRSKMHGAALTGLEHGQGLRGWVAFLALMGCFVLMSALGADASGQALPAPTGLSAAPGDGSVTLSWAATPGAAGYNLKLSTTRGGSYRTIASNVQGKTVRLQKLSNGTTYYCVVSAVNAGGEGPDSQEVSATPNSIGGAESKWIHTDVGPTAKAGSGTDLGGGKWSLAGSGWDIWYTGDEFHYVYQSVRGDLTIICRVDSIQDTDEWAKSGVMFRNGTSGGAVYAGLFVTSRHGVTFQVRSEGDSATQNVVTIGGIAASPNNPVWLKLVKDGSATRAFYASGQARPTEWIPCGSSDRARFGGTFLAGLVVCSHNRNALCSSSFSEVALSPANGGSQNRSPVSRDAATLDAVAVGEPQSEKDHAYAGEEVKDGIVNGRRWRDGRWFQYTLNSRGQRDVVLAVTYCGDDTNRKFDILANGTRVATEELRAERPGEFFERTYVIPREVLAAAPQGKVTIRFTAVVWVAGGVFDVRLLKAE